MAPRSTKPRWKIDDVLARTDLAALLDDVAQPGRYATRGHSWHCPVPGHEDNNPSVKIHTDRHGHERWKCWSGDTSHRGDAIDLVMITQRVPRSEAIDWLASRAGMIPDQPLPPVRRQPRPALPEHVPLHPAVIAYAQGCAKRLWTDTGRPVLDWLHQRGFTDDTLHANLVGVDPGRNIMPRRRGLPYGHSIAATFPAFNPAGDIHYLQARYLQPVGTDKYDNPASALGTHPRVTWTRTPGGITHPGLLLICEGIPDALTAAQAGYRTLGIMGKDAPDARVAAQLARHTTTHDDRLIAIIDADNGGHIWKRNLTNLLADHEIDLTVIEPPNGLDLNDWARTQPDWAALLPAREPFTLHASRATELLPDNSL